MKAMRVLPFLMFLLAALLLAPSQTIATTTNLDEIQSFLPFNVVHIPAYDVPLQRQGTLLPLSLVNADQDPELEIIFSRDGHVNCEEYSTGRNMTRWQLNLPAEFHHPDRKIASFGISGALDLGHEKTMVVITGTTHDFMSFRFWVVDAENGTIESQFDLPGGPDINQDKKWDGSYFVLGAMDVPAETGPRKALIMICDTGFDLDKRGAYAVDPWTGEILWSFMPGSALTHNYCYILDLDGNGTEEILLASRAPHNLHGRKVNGFSDDRPYMFALKADGSLLWHRELDSEPGYTNLQTGDLDGDGSLEIVTAVHNIYQKKGSLSVWNSQGELQVQLEKDYQILGCQLIPAHRENHLDIIFGNRYSSLFRIRYENQQLEIQQKATRKRGLNMMGMLDLPGPSGEKGIIIQDRDGVGLILDRDFKVVGTYQDAGKKVSRSVVIGQMEDNPSFFLLNANPGSFILERNPLAVAGYFARHFKNPRLLVLSGLGLGLLIAGMIWLATRRPHEDSPASVLQPTDNPLHLKERRLHLMEDLEVSNHGAMAPLRSLRRLVWMLDALQSGVGMNPNLMARMKEIWQDCHEDALPRLTNILERAHHAQVSESVVDEALAAISRINISLADLNTHGFSVEAIDRHQANLHKEEKTTEALLQSLRHQVSDFFCASLSDVLDKVLRANQAALEENSVEIQTGILAAMEAGGAGLDLTTQSPHCRMDADELGFILDNLVGNACLAMASARHRKLSITWQPVNGMVKIEVSDTGIGIATDDHQRVMEPGFSSRPGGGLGLSKSQRLLRKYDGHLKIKCSQPGQGTTFSLIVPRA